MRDDKHGQDGARTACPVAFTPLLFETFQPGQQENVKRGLGAWGRSYMLVKSRFGHPTARDKVRDLTRVRAEPRHFPMLGLMVHIMRSR